MPSKRMIFKTYKFSLTWETKDNKIYRRYYVYRRKEGEPFFFDIDDRLDDFPVMLQDFGSANSLHEHPRIRRSWLGLRIPWGGTTEGGTDRRLLYRSSEKVIGKRNPRKAKPHLPWTPGSASSSPIFVTRPEREARPSVTYVTVDGVTRPAQEKRSSNNTSSGNTSNSAAADPNKRSSNTSSDNTGEGLRPVTGTSASAGLQPPATDKRPSQTPSDVTSIIAAADPGNLLHPHKGPSTTAMATATATGTVTETAPGTATAVASTLESARALARTSGSTTRTTESLIPFPPSESLGGNDRVLPDELAQLPVPNPQTFERVPEFVDSHLESPAATGETQSATGETQPATGETQSATGETQSDESIPYACGSAWAAKRKLPAEPTTEGLTPFPPFEPQDEDGQQLSQGSTRRSTPDMPNLEGLRDFTESDFEFEEPTGDSKSDKSMKYGLRSIWGRKSKLPGEPKAPSL